VIILSLALICRCSSVVYLEVVSCHLATAAFQSHLINIHPRPKQQHNDLLVALRSRQMQGRQAA
jgi:hypothetical protein